MLLSKVYKSVKNEWSAIENLCLTKNVPEHVWIANCTPHGPLDTGRDQDGLSWVHGVDRVFEMEDDCSQRRAGVGWWVLIIWDQEKVLRSQGPSLKKLWEDQWTNFDLVAQGKRFQLGRIFKRYTLEKVERLDFQAKAWMFYPECVGGFSQKFGAREFMNKKYVRLI